MEMPRIPQQHRKFKKHGHQNTTDTSKTSSCRQRWKLPFVRSKFQVKWPEQLTIVKYKTDWKAVVCGMLESTPDFQKESSRLCKKCFPKVESLIKRCKEFEGDKREKIEVRNLQTN